MSDSAIGAEPLRATVSGSFKRHLAEIQLSVATLQAHGVVVLSPAEPTIVDQFGDFVFVASDRRRSIKGIQNRHLAAILHSDFLWLCCTDGYIGQSAAMEIGFAIASGVAVYSDSAPSDLTLRQYCHVTGTIDRALLAARGSDRRSEVFESSLLVSPEVALSQVHGELATIEEHLVRGTPPTPGDPVEEAAARARRLLTLHAKA